MAAHVLIVDDDPAMLRALSRSLEGRGYEVTTCRSGEEAIELFTSTTPDVALMDVHMPGITGLETLGRLRASGNDVPVLIMSGAGTIDMAVTAVHEGAQDFIEKPIRRERLIVSLENALHNSRVAARYEALASGMDPGDLLGRSEPMTQLRALVARAAPTDGRVLILGENGTGKELVARALHRGSNRADEPFLKINCAAVPSELIESELFGHVKGAFTGATSARKGKFELADHGTILLDEVGDMPAMMQAKLLRLLQEGELEPVGSQQTRSVDVRVLAATNRDLGQLVEAGDFREDLFYRLNVVRVEVPPLRTRKDDIPELVSHFLSDLGARPTVRLDDAAMSRLQEHDFPGNVRELRNLIERLLILCPNDTIGASDVDLGLSGRTSPHKAGQALYEPGRSLKQCLATAERQIIAQALDANDGSMAATARALELERSHLYKKVKAHEIDRS